ncbi:hypothetical protein [Alkalimarinus coralli]|uniref:hypothetical protein n=1 Tax=Alkalimarinus coralli TaxID=2935863 RepID=UPI00202B3591|nr:hypothetical protein [Alkalimarinus coralli]
MFRRSKVFTGVVAAVAAMSSLPALVSASPTVEVTDYRFNSGASMLAYTEFELSGEPLAESLGLDLDVLDPSTLNQPTRFDYVAGIESYEYSEEAMYALNYQSRMGPHLVNGPLNKARGGKMENLGSRFVELAKSVAYPPEEIPLNLYPISLPYRSGLPELAEAVDMTTVNKDELELTDANGKTLKTTALIPAYYRDYKTLGWVKSERELVIEPAAVGGILLKEVMWSQDFLGGMHVIESDEEVEAESAKMDQDGKHALGVSAVDGMNGVILTEMSVDKMLMLQDQLGFDGKQLGVKVTPDYDPTKQPVWFPHAIKVDETEQNGVNALGKLSVTASESTLRDTWMLLWPTSEYFAFTDQRSANTGQNPAFRAVFDGQPFAAAPAKNVDASSGNDVAAADGFSLASNLSSMLFKNIDALHFNNKAGTFVDRFDGKQGDHVTTYDAAYSIVALSIFQRAQDALPVGYASAEASDLDLKTAQGKRAIEMIQRQAEFIVSKLRASNGLVADGATVSGKQDKAQSLDAQFAAIRGLSAAFIATGDTRYRDEARALYVAVEKTYFDAELGTWSLKGGVTEQTPWTAAAISGALRETMLHLKNSEGEKEASLELATLVERYTTWFRTVINGNSTEQGLQLAEWIGDSGENVIEGKGGDTDADNVPQVTAAGGKHGRAMVFAGKVRVSK